jgi:glutathione S-transferase
VAQYVEVEQAVGMSGLRVVLSPGVPGPWSEAAKGIVYVKKIPYVKVRQELAGENVALLNWTKQTTAPAFVYNNERPRTIWNDQLILAERIAPEPALIPSNIEDRALMFGYSNELCGENGFGWSRRLMLHHVTLTDPKASEEARKRSVFMGNKYGYAPQIAEGAPARCVEVLRLLANRLATQRARGSRFFVGDRLSALDIYWAAFAALIQPLPDELCKIPPAFRERYTCKEPRMMAAVTPQLLAHRDFIYHEYLELPLDM